jgi:hypothetical protein
MSKMKILIIAVHGPYEPWTSILKNGQLKTWSQNNLDDIHIVHAMGNPVTDFAHNLGEYFYSLKWANNKYLGFAALLVDKIMKKIIGNKLFKISTYQDEISKCEFWRVEMPDFALLMGNKMLTVLKFAHQNYEFDFLATTISSSYVNIENLKSFTKDLKPERILGGRFVDVGDEHFQQGAFRLYSRDVIEYIVTNRKSYNHTAPEDVAMGRLVNTGSFQEYEMRNSTIDSVKSAEKVIIKEIRKDIFIRCKGVSTLGSKVRFDTEILNIVHDKLTIEEN